MKPHLCIPDSQTAHRPICMAPGCELPCSNRRVHVERDEVPVDTRYEPEEAADEQR